MMKNLFIGLGVLAMIAATSCKKDYTCECTTTANGISASTATTIKDTKKNAEEACEAGSSSVSAGGATTSVKCELK